MDTTIEFLSTPLGIELLHAIILLILAIAGYLTYLTKRSADAASSKLDQHLLEHAVLGSDPPQNRT
jgi:hypothetical protein